MKAGRRRWGAAVLLLVSLAATAAGWHRASRLSSLQHEFTAYSGAQLVFDREELPAGAYHEIMPALPRWRCEQAAQICLAEARKYPPGYLGRVHLQAIGVFAGCASARTDGRRTFDPELGGYLYYGISNQANACAAAYYSDRQLRLTFHHEIFHHVDAVAAAASGAEAAEDTARRYREAVAGQAPYPSPAIRPPDLERLQQLGSGEVLEGSVSRYAEKDIGEDQAETARYLLTTLPDSLLQAVERPELPGTQRILYCLQRYGQAVPDGPGIDWFVDAALGRSPQ